MLRVTLILVHKVAQVHLSRDNAHSQLDRVGFSDQVLLLATHIFAMIHDHICHLHNQDACQRYEDLSVILGVELRLVVFSGTASIVVSTAFNRAIGNPAQNLFFSPSLNLECRRQTVAALEMRDSFTKARFCQRRRERVS